MPNGIRFKLAHANGDEVQPLAKVLTVIRKHGFRTFNPKVRTGPAGSFLVATLVYAEEDAMERWFRGRGHAFAMLRICSELGAECWNNDAPQDFLHYSKVAA